jgi:hypothetical protein
VIDAFVSTEGLVGHSDPGGLVLTFASDTCIAECVDQAGRPAPDGTASARVLVTNLHNLTQPLIRYELTDRFTRAGSSPGGFLRASVEGRAGDVFCYGTTTVHPSALTTALLRAVPVREYQVRQTARGADITVVADPGLDEAALAAAVQDSLRQVGVTRPQATISRAEAIARDPRTGKVRRLIAAGGHSRSPADRPVLGRRPLVAKTPLQVSRTERSAQMFGYSASSASARAASCAGSGGSHTTGSRAPMTSGWIPSSPGTGRRGTGQCISQARAAARRRDR